MPAEANPGAGGRAGAPHAPLVAAMADPAGGHQITFCDGADLDGEGHLQEDGPAHADDVGQLLGSVDQARPAGPGPDEVGRDDLVGDRQVAVPQL